VLSGGAGKPRQPGVFVFLSGKFRLRIQLVRGRNRIAEESKPEEGKKYCGASASIGALELKLHSGQPPAS
jgi:hypothetical protein